MLQYKQTTCPGKQRYVHDVHLSGRFEEASWFHTLSEYTQRVCEFFPRKIPFTLLLFHQDSVEWRTDVFVDKVSILQKWSADESVVIVVEFPVEVFDGIDTFNNNFTVHV